jgi:SIR2-like domain
MEWKIAWRDRQSPYPVQKETLTSEADLKQRVAMLIDKEARDISISQIPPQRDLGGIPYADIVTSFKNRTIVPFLGAGVPLCGRPSGSEWQYAPFSNFLPSGAELADYIARLANLPAWRLRDTENLARVASYYTKTNPNTPLADRLRKIFERGEITEVHRFLATPALHPMVIVTTNYDTLMEDALEEAGVPFDTVIHCTNIAQQGRVILRKHKSPPGFVEPGEVDLSPESRTVLYKMHGSIDRQPDVAVSTPANSPQDSYVITEEDYVKFLSRLNAAPPVIPLRLANHFRKSQFLFLGYSLEDWNVRVILDSLNTLMNDPGVPIVPLAPTGRVDVPTNGPPPAANPLAEAFNIPPPRSTASEGLPARPRYHWAVQFQPTSYDIAVWNGRGVQIQDSDLKEFVKTLQDPIYNLFL